MHTIREFQASDTLAVIALWQRVFGDEHGHNGPEQKIARKTDLGDGLFSVAVSNQRVVGTVMAGYDGVRGWVYALAVLPDFQRRGIGRSLLVRAETQLCDLGCVKLNLQTREPTSDSLSQFYESCGFSIEPRISFGKLLIGTHPDSHQLR